MGRQRFPAERPREAERAEERAHDGEGVEDDDDRQEINGRVAGGGGGDGGGGGGGGGRRAMDLP